MSHIIKEYSKCFNVSPSVPTIKDHFYPIPFEKYITIESSIAVECINYDYFNIVIKLLRDYIPELKVVDITNREQEADYADYSTLGKTSYKHILNIISNSQLHLCVDSYSSYLSSMINIPTVCLYGGMPPINTAPNYNTDNYCSLFRCKENQKPSYSIKDPNKVINNINPEEVARVSLDFLDTDHKLEGYETMRIGKYFKDNILEVIPDFLPPDNYSPERLINLRCDYHFDEPIIQEWLKFKINLMVNKAIDLSILHKYASNIAGITFFLGDETLTPSYINDVSSLNLNPVLICKDEDIISDVRLSFFHMDVEKYKFKSKKNLDINLKSCNNYYYASNKYLYSKGQKYSSKAAWAKNITSSDKESLIDNDDFWEEVEHFNIYSYAKKKNRRNK
jgi:hypothetical protein